MDAPTYERRRTGWDIVIGILLIIGGLIVLGNAVAATAISVLFLAWIAVIAGVIEIVQAFLRIKSGGFWSAALGGAVLVALGVFLLRHPAVGALSLTLLAGCLFLVVGLTRIFVAPQTGQLRWPFIVSGLISAILGLLVLFNLTAATLTLLGILIGVQLLVEGVTLLVAGRMHAVQPGSAPTGSQPAR